MKKTFKLKVENKHPDRLVEAIKHEIRKYIKREKRKALPEDKDYWNFNCKFGKDDNEVQTIDFIDITRNIDEAASEGCESFYIEILKNPAKRPPKVVVKLEDSEEIQ